MDNYTGPYRSDGKWQTSVAFGTSVPLDDVDRASRLHDSAYAHYTDESHRTAADILYQEMLAGNVSTKGRIVRGLPVYGNYVKNRAAEYGEGFATGMKLAGLPGALGGVVLTGARNIWRQFDLLNNLDKYKREVTEYYKTDPLAATHQSYETEVNADKPITQVNIKKNAPNNAPLQKSQKPENQFEMKFFKNKTAPEVPLGLPGSQPKNKILPEALRQLPLYQPLKKKKRRETTADDLLLYLKYNPTQVARVQAWLDTHPDILNPTARHKTK